jgi:hypothetical protein
VPFSLALVGDITLNGPLSQAASTLSISVRVARYGATFSDAVTPIITLRAPARDWAQLPARATLAVLDALSVQLNEDERIDLLRDASPLMPAASPARLAAEQRLGQATAAGIEAQWLLEQARRTGSAAQKRDLLQKSVRQGNLSMQGLRAVAALAPPALPTERTSYNEMRGTAQSWLTPAGAMVRASQASLQTLKQQPVKAPAWQASSRHRTKPAAARSSKPAAQRVR